MRRFLIALTCCFFVSSISAFEEKAKEEFSLSLPEQVGSLRDIESTHLIGDLISPLSGQPVLRATDLIARGAQDIILSRTYNAPFIPCNFEQHKRDQQEWDKYHFYKYAAHHYKGWQYYPHLKLLLKFFPLRIMLTDPQGASLEFRLSGRNGSIIIPCSSYALSNLAGDIPGGKYDIRNTRIKYAEEDLSITVYAPDGTVRLYSKRGHHSPTEILYLLKKEILPNGKILRYHYSASLQLAYVESLDPKERFVYASICINGSPWENDCHFVSSNGLSADYRYQTKSFPVKIKEKYKKGKIKIEGTLVHPPTLSSISSPFFRYESLEYNDRHLLNAYSGRDHTFKLHYSEVGKSNPYYRVQQLFMPVGPNDTFMPVYDLSYDPPVPGTKEGATHVKCSDGTSIIYRFSKRLLLDAIQYFGQDETLKKEKRFFWYDNQWLKNIEMRDSQNTLFYRKSYEYDKFGNPILEALTGDLSGEGKEETYTIKRKYSEDGKNLLLREEEESGKVTCFSYLENTNLITTRLTKNGDKILLREFSVYDDANNLIQTITDDGSSEDKDNLSNVTQRKLKTFILRQSAPFLHMSEWIEETYLEKGIEKLLKKSHLIYDQHGNFAQEEVYDDTGKHAFTLCKTYNERGDVLTETNRLGQEASYTYDLKGRPETFLNFSNRVLKTFRYDLKGRLCEVTEKGDDGVIHSVLSEYDSQDRKIHKKDLFSNSTHYLYDPTVNAAIKTEFPPIISMDGTAVEVTTSSTYDSFGRELTQTDANGNSKIYRYNTYGSPAEIIYPGGKKEVFRYEKNGKLSRSTDLDGLTTCYTYDVFGRVLLKTYVSAEGDTIAEEAFTYNGFNLLTETNKEGNVKKYSYDGAGRKIREEFCGHISSFTYDSQGHLVTICKHNGENTLLIHYKRDLEGKLLEESKTDTSGYLLYKINYSYDRDGNQETITRHINSQEAVEMFTYDPFGRQIKRKDALGHVTQTLYNESCSNQLGQRVLQISTIDPHHTMTVETKDALSRTVKQEVLDSQNKLLSCHEMIYDPHGNLLYRMDHAYENGNFLNTQTLKYSYTLENRVASLTRAFGTKEERTTSYTYFPSGKIASKALPDGVALTYDYHPLGFMSRLDSSDGRIHHVFEYDLLGHLKCATDENQRITITRKVDPFGNVLQETFPYGFEVKKDYDDFNRISSLKMGSQGNILYTYDPLFLRKVTRISPLGETLYEHSYEEYDEDGNLLLENLIENLGSITHETDCRGHKTSISSPYFSEKCEYDALGNLIKESVDTEETSYSYDKLSQLSSENSSLHSMAYTHDSIYNRTQKNGALHEVNKLNELLSVENVQCAYDLNGNQILKQTPSEAFHFSYDPLHRLIEAISGSQKIDFNYDPLGRCLNKTIFKKSARTWKEVSREHYLYHGQHEIGAFASLSEPKNLRILGLTKHPDMPATIGIEIDGQITAPLSDIQGNIRRLIDVETKTIVDHYDFTAFGEEKYSDLDSTSFNPWRFASKRFDPHLRVINFGKRHYDPLLGRWLTIDPAGFVDSSNLYQYVFNNPFRYKDPDGRFVIVVPLIAFTWKVVAVAAVSAFVAYELEHQHQHSNSAFARNFNSAAHQIVQSLGGASQYMINKVYAPDRPLPRDEDGVPISDADAPHTQLGTKKGSKGNYPQAREFDKEGQPVRDIDFTDHGRPDKHPNPHQHKHEPNGTGGTPARSRDPQPVPEWRYK